MEKLVFDYTYCDFPECWEWNVPFEYESKDKFILDVWNDPMLLTRLNIKEIYEFQLEDINNNEWFSNLDQYVFTLDEWFNKNKTT